MVFITIIIFRVMASMTTTLKFKMEKFDRKKNFLLLVNEGIHKVLLGAEKKLSKMEDESGWISMIEPRPLLTDKVLYNVMNEGTL